MRLEEWAFVHPDKYKYISTITGNAVTDELVRTVADDFETCWQKNTIIYGSDLFSPLIGLEKILSSAIIQIRGMFHDKKGLHSRIQRTDIKGIPGGWECFACR